MRVQSCRSMETTFGRTSADRGSCIENRRATISRASERFARARSEFGVGEWVGKPEPDREPRTLADLMDGGGVLVGVCGWYSEERQTVFARRSLGGRLLPPNLDVEYATLRIVSRT